MDEDRPGTIRAMQAHEMAIAWIDEVIATKKRHAAEDEAERLKTERDVCRSS